MVSTVVEAGQVLEINYFPDRQYKGYPGVLEVNDGTGSIVRHGVRTVGDVRQLVSDYESLYGVKAKFCTEVVEAPKAVDVEQKGLVSRSAPKRAVVGGRSVSID